MLFMCSHWLIGSQNCCGLNRRARLRRGTFLRWRADFMEDNEAVVFWFYFHVDAFWHNCWCWWFSPNNYWEKHLNEMKIVSYGTIVWNLLHSLWLKQMIEVEHLTYMIHDAWTQPAHTVSRHTTVNKYRTNCPFTWWYLIWNCWCSVVPTPLTPSPSPAVPQWRVRPSPNPRRQPGRDEGMLCKHPLCVFEFLSLAFIWVAVCICVLHLTESDSASFARCKGSLDKHI